MGGFLVFVGSVGIGIGVIAALKGSLPRFKLAGRQQGAWVVLAGFLLLYVGAALAGPGVPENKEPGPGIPAGAQKAVVARNVDGDTIWVEVTEGGGPLPPAAVHKIRILEIDSPESTRHHGCYGRQASEFARRELPVGSTVYLLADKEDKDRFGRFLRYVWKENGEFYNEKIIKAGLAKAVLYPPNDLYIDQLRAAEARARRSARGLWRACAPKN